MDYNKLQNFIERSKMTKREIANRCKISRQTLDAILHGADTKISTIETIVNVVGFSMSQLYADANLVKEISANGNDNINSIDSSVSVNGCRSASDDDDPRVLRERIRGLEAQLRNKEEIIEILKSKN